VIVGKREQLSPSGRTLEGAEKEPESWLDGLKARRQKSRPIHDRNARPRYDVKPLVATAMRVSRPAFRRAGAITICAACAFFVLKATRNSFPD
jgi:hypothetical protein